jgi:hypothetical protein
LSFRGIAAGTQLFALQVTISETRGRNFKKKNMWGQPPSAVRSAQPGKGFLTVIEFNGEERGLP